MASRQGVCPRMRSAGRRRASGCMLVAPGGFTHHRLDIGDEGTAAMMIMPILCSISRLSTMQRTHAMAGRSTALHTCDAMHGQLAWTQRLHTERMLDGT